MPLGLLTFVEGLLGPKFEKFAKPLIYGVLAILAVAAFFGAKAIYDHGVITKHDAKVEQRAKPATDQAAAERAVDTITIAKSEKDSHDAIHSVPDAAPAGPSHALACKRLSDHGRHPPACGGPPSGH